MIASNPPPPPTAMPMIAPNERLEEVFVVVPDKLDELISVEPDPGAVITSVVVATGRVKEARAADESIVGISPPRVMPSWEM